MRIDVTRTHLPPLDEYRKLLEAVWASGHITNGGPLVVELERKLADLFDTPYFIYVSNGTSALQIALDAMGVDGGEVLTTPFSYVATVSSILWQRCKPIFVDIDPVSLCMDPTRIEAAITDKTRAILPVHVFGIPCALAEIDAIAKRHGIPVLYDAAHAFGVRYQGRSLISFGDASTCSFHATKLFHTIEGGGIATNNPELYERAELARRFGHNGDEHLTLGINAKNSEFHAAMGLVNLRHITRIIEDRKTCSLLYDSLLSPYFQRLAIAPDVEYNYSYYPIIPESSEQTFAIIEALNKQDIYPRRYFYPSLDNLRYLKEANPCPVSDDISQRILCLPLYYGLSADDIERISKILLDAVADGMTGRR